MRYTEIICEVWTEADDEDARLFDVYLKKKGIDINALFRMSAAELERSRADARANRQLYPIPVTEPMFLYHGTARARLPEIARHGLMPSERSRWSRDVSIGNWSLGKVFFIDTVGTAEFYGKQASRSRPVILRVPRTMLTDAVTDPKQEDGYYVERTVPPEVIEYWNGRKWAPMRSRR